MGMIFERDHFVSDGFALALISIEAQSQLMETKCPRDLSSLHS